MTESDRARHDNYGPEARHVVECEAELPTAGWEREVARGLESGLPDMDSIMDNRRPTSSRGERSWFGPQGVRKISVPHGHSIGYPTTRVVTEQLTGDNQATDLDERMHTTPWFHAPDLSDVPPRNLVHIGFGDWEAPRPGNQVNRQGMTTMRVIDRVEADVEATGERGSAVARDGADAVRSSLAVGCPHGADELPRTAR